MLECWVNSTKEGLRKLFEATTVNTFSPKTQETEMLEISELVLGRITQADETISLLFHYPQLWVDMAEDEQPPTVARLLMTLTT